jgi:hypothetical protein
VCYITPPENRNVYRGSFRTASFISMRVAIRKASPYMDEADIRRSGALVDKREDDAAKLVREIMHTNNNGDEVLLTPAAWAKAIIRFLNCFNDCETELIRMMNDSVTKEKPAPACKKPVAGTCEAPCVATNVASRLKFLGLQDVTRCVYNRALIDEVKADPGGIWSARGCGLHYV